MLEARDLSLIYCNERNDEFYAIHDVNFFANRGEMIGIVGPSGSGKSSLLYILSGLKKPTVGTVYYQEHALEVMSYNELAEIRRKEYGFIFQRHFLINYLTVLDNVLSVVNRNDKFWRNTAINLLETLGIADFANQKPYKMSVGERQKVAIARALVSQPKIIFADEPTASLDHSNARMVMDIFASLKGEITILVATHDDSILDQADRVIHMWDGRIAKSSIPVSSIENIKQSNPIMHRS